METTATLSSSAALASSTLSNDHVPAHHANSVVAFLIGLSIILLASIMNAAGLNLTKLDHVRTSAVPKSERRKDWMRPLWLLGMLLYILSQIIGSTLALEYMRAEYVAPLGSSSLVFNFLFARFLVGTPVTNNDIYGTIIVVLGVVGIVAFGSINSGLSQGTDVAHLTELWRRGGWLGFFFAMGGALYLLLLFTSRLDAILTVRNDLKSAPPSGQRSDIGSGAGIRVRKGFFGKLFTIFAAIKAVWDWTMTWIDDLLEWWANPKDDKQVAWTLGIGWACCGGGLAGGTLVFAKATVKLLSGSLSHQNPGNQFGHAAPIFTIIFLVLTAVLQIICLNRGLRVYDSTLVVPVFYGVYTATGFLDSLIFNNEVDSYKSWTLFLIFLSMIILISGVVLLTHKKPEPVTTRIKGAATPRTAATMEERRQRAERRRSRKPGDEENQADEIGEGGEDERLWAVGEASDGDDEGDDPDIDHHLHPMYRSPPGAKLQRRGSNGAAAGIRRPRAASGSSSHGRGDSEAVGLISAADGSEEDGDADEENSDAAPPSNPNRKRGKGKNRRRSMDPFHDNAVVGGTDSSELEVFGLAGNKRLR